MSSPRANPDARWVTMCAVGKGGRLNLVLRIPKSPTSHPLSTTTLAALHSKQLGDGAGTGTRQSPALLSCLLLLAVKLNRGREGC